MYDLLLNHINHVYGTSFLYTESCENDGNWEHIFHSSCIFDPFPENNKQVTLYINQYGFANINCYHEKCKNQLKYAQILNCINKHAFSYWELYTCGIFSTQVDSIEEAFDA